LAQVASALTERGSASFFEVPTVEASIDAYMAIRALRVGAADRLIEITGALPAEEIGRLLDAVLGTDVT